MSVELDLAGRLIAALLFGAFLGGASVYLVHRRVERVLRFAIDRRDQDYATLMEMYLGAVQQITTMRREGFGGHGKGAVRDAPDPELEALARAERVGRARLEDAQFIDRTVADLRVKRPELSDAARRKEAARLLRETRMEQPSS